MEGDAGSGQLNPSPPTSTDDEAKRSEAEESVDTADSAPADEVGLEAEQLDAPAQESQLAVPAASSELAVPAAASRLGGRGWLVSICVLLLLLTAGSATAGALALRSHQKAAAAARADVLALAAAKDCVTATQAPDATVMSESQRKIIDCSTGDFGAQAALYSGLLVDAYQAANVQVQVSDMRAAVERHNSDGSIDVLVAVRVKVSNTQAADQEQGYRLRVRMAQDGGVYKIAKLDQVSK
jgi:Mce-associated membrane protein